MQEAMTKQAREEEYITSASFNDSQGREEGKKPRQAPSS
jgi:hypothetical protein